MALVGTLSEQERIEWVNDLTKNTWASVNNETAQLFLHTILKQREYIAELEQPVDGDAQVTGVRPGELPIGVVLEDPEKGTVRISCWPNVSFDMPKPDAKSERLTYQGIPIYWESDIMELGELLRTSVAGLGFHRPEVYARVLGETALRWCQTEGFKLAPKRVLKDGYYQAESNAKGPCIYCGSGPWNCIGEVGTDEVEHCYKDK